MPATGPFDLLVAGGGPAGLAAAAQAAAVGLKVVVVDERVTPGGQIYKQLGPGFVVEDPAALGADQLRGRTLTAAAHDSGAELWLRTSVVAVDGESVVVVTDGQHARTVTARRLLVVAGAHDRPVPFSGWTLPGVITAGGAQTLVKTQRVLPGQRIVFAGAGPLALAFPAQLAGYGANVVLVTEAGPAPRPSDLLRLLRAAPGNRDVLQDAVRYRAALVRHRIPLRYGRIVVRAEGDGRVEQVTHAAVYADWRVVSGTEETEAVDTLCVGYGFTPSVELLRQTGARFGDDEDRGGPVAVLDAWQRATVPNVYAAGDGTGVEGVHVAVDEGRLAALGVALDAGRLDPAAAEAAAAPLRARLRRRRALRAALGRMHRVGPGLHELATAETVVCRCEEVTQAQLETAVAATADPSVVKGLTRAGMGLCQGRNCQRHVAALVARTHGVPLADVPMATPRLPARPVPLSAVADASIGDDGYFH